jgi:hypothetical protein
MGTSNTKDLLLNAIRQDKDKDMIKKILLKNPDLKNCYVNKNSDHTALCMAAYYGSLNAFKTLVDVFYI